METVESLLRGSGTSHPPSSAFNPKAKAAAAFPETAPGLNPRAIMSFAQDLEQVTLFILIIEVELMKYFHSCMNQMKLKSFHATTF